jgi:hypothetical protein
VIWPVLAFASLAINIAALVRVGAREPRSILSFGVGADVDLAAREAENFVETGTPWPSHDEPAANLFDDSMWMDAATEDPEEISALDEEIETDDGRFGTDLWARPELVGGA